MSHVAVWPIEERQAQGVGSGLGEQVGHSARIVRGQADPDGGATSPEDWKRAELARTVEHADRTATAPPT